jgi:peptidoglycan/xylan/chitin deacetylase (PgdA/CDA1 family)
MRKTNSSRYSNQINSHFRLDRFLTLYFFYPLLRILPKNKELRIPILMYHSISEPKQKQKHPYYETCISRRVFAEHMKFLYDNNYAVINLKDIQKYFNNKEYINRKAAVITFDDGFRDFYTDAFPILQRYAFSATVFLPTAYIEKERLRFKEKECLCWSEVRDLNSKGIQFGSHTVNHCRLSMLSKKDVEFELRESKDKIENEIGESILLFSYPYAFPEQDKKFIIIVKKILEDCGYKKGATTSIGTVTVKDDCLFLKRIPVNEFDDILLYKRKIRYGYDWLGTVQALVKKTRRVLNRRI